MSGRIFSIWKPAARFSAGRRNARPLHLEPLEGRSLLAPIADIANVAPDPRTTAVGEVFISFRDSVTGLASDVTGVDIVDFELTRDGSDVSLAGLSVIGSGDTYSLDLTTVTNEDGDYVLTLVAAGSGIIDSAILPLTQDALDNWVIDTTAPSAHIVNISPDPRNTAVGLVTINFDEEVEGVDVHDFTLTRDGANVSLAGLTVNGSFASYTLNLSTVTGSSGAYVLTLVAANSEIRDSVGNPLTADASDSWTTDTSPPTAVIVPIAPDPRTTAVGNVSINFSESVSGVDINDFTLTRNGTSVSLAGLTVGGSGASYTLNLSTVTVAAGTYVLTLVAANSGIADGLGNAFASNASDTWVNDTTAPTADIVDITPDPRTTPVGNVSINFSEAVIGVDINDFTLTRSGTAVSLVGQTVAGSGATYTIDLSSVTTSFGSYTLTLVAAGSGITDLAGNAMTANASDAWSSDDAREQNDTLRTAHELGRLTGPVTLDSLGLVDANDWYRFTTTAKGTSSDFVSISFQNAQGNLDLELYNVSGQKLKSSTGNTDSEKVSLSGLKAGTYYARVFGKAGVTNPSYTMTINVRSIAATTATAKNASAAIDAVMANWSPTTSGVRKTSART